jgi:hypothetical protein
MSNKNGRIQRGQKKESSAYSIANRVRFTRWRDKNAYRAGLKAAIIQCSMTGLMSFSTAEFLIDRGGLRHV